MRGTRRRGRDRKGRLKRQDIEAWYAGWVEGM